MTKNKRTSTIKSHLTADEHGSIQQQANCLGLSVSDYIRSVMVNYRVPESRINAGVVRELYKVSADLARLGNLQKMAMNDDELQVPSSPTISYATLVETINQTVIDLKLKIEKLC